jgi:hypothetical protein
MSLRPFRARLRLAPHPTRAPLLPKLRGHFAEFLNEGSPDRLGILYPSTSVGLRYGHVDLARGFSRQHGLSHLWPYGHRLSPLRIQQRIYLLPSSPYRLGT